jgi:hypothetical protein
MAEISPQNIVKLNTIQDIRQALPNLSIGNGYLLIGGYTEDGSPKDKYYFVNKRFQPQPNYENYLEYRDDYNTKYKLIKKQEATGGTEDSNTQNIYIYSLNKPPTTDEKLTINGIKADNGILLGGKKRKRTKKNKKRKSKKCKSKRRRQK